MIVSCIELGTTRVELCRLKKVAIRIGSELKICQIFREVKFEAIAQNLTAIEEAVTRKFSSPPHDMSDNCLRYHRRTYRLSTEHLHSTFFRGAVNRVHQLVLG